MLPTGAAGEPCEANGESGLKNYETIPPAWQRQPPYGLPPFLSRALRGGTRGDPARLCELDAGGSARELRDFDTSPVGGRESFGVPGRIGPGTARYAGATGSRGRGPGGRERAALLLREIG